VIASFLQRSFVAPNIRTIARQELARQLDGHLFHNHESEGEGAYPKSALVIWTTGPPMTGAGFGNIIRKSLTSRTTT
jgi:hypothetical protein